MSLERFRDKNGFYTGTDGRWHDTAADLVQCGILGFCGCGDHAANLRYVRDGLRHIRRQFYDEAADLDSWRAWHAAGVALFGSEASQQFFFYWADKEGLTEHGAGIPGWLTEKGEQLLADLEEALLQFSYNP